MSLEKFINTPCTKCHKDHKVKVYDSINVGLEPELKAKVMDGSLFLWECPHCGTLNLIQSPTLYHDPNSKLMIWYFYEGMDETYKSSLKSFEEKLSHYTLRTTNTLNDLIEKIKIFDAGLNDVTMEMCKYVTKMELVERSTDPKNAQALLDAKFTFFEINGADNEIVMMFPLNGKGNMVKTGFSIYEDCQRIIDRNPDIKPAEGFAKVDDEWLNTKLR